MFKPIAFIAAVCAAAASSAGAQDLVIAAQPPVYVVGEYFTGTATSPNGQSFDLQQVARKGTDGRIYLHMFIVGQNGDVVWHTVSDPHAWLKRMESADVNAKTLSTDCSRRDLFPIVLGKVYECTSQVRINAQETTLKERVEINEVFRNKQGGIVGFCMRHQQDDGTDVATARTCMTPDGKWTRSMTIESIVSQPRT